MVLFLLSRLLLLIAAEGTLQHPYQTVTRSTRRDHVYRPAEAGTVSGKRLSEG